MGNKSIQYRTCIKGIPEGLNETVESDIKSSLVVGTTIESKSKNIFLRDTLFAFDYDLNSPNNRFKKNFHMGIERTFFDVFHVRGGLNQGYIVGGFGFTVRISGFPLSFTLIMHIIQKKWDQKLALNLFLIIHLR